MSIIRGLVAAAVLAAPALVQAAPVDANPFTGFRVEGHLGYDRVHIEDLGHASGLTYGAGAGYDLPLGHSLIAGVEVNGDFSNTDREAFGVHVKAKRDLDVSARLGAVVGARTLVYAKVGYANARIGTNGFGSGNFDGIRGAVGVEYAFSNRVYLKGEYRYSNYESGVDRNQAIAGIGFRF